jgi:hypothetical protein
MRRQQTWRVRVRRTIEDWVDVQADTILEAEEKAADLPNVARVLTGSTIRGDKPVGQYVPPAGAIEDEDE